jgi:hypothetical protein
LQLFGGSFSGSREHGGPSAEDDVFAHIEVAFHDRLIDHFVERWHLQAVLLGIEQGLRTTETLISKCYEFSVRKLIGAIVAVSFFII